MLKLNLGCSDHAIPGYTGVDLWTPPWATDANFQKADLRLIWPWEDGSVDEIIAADILEHLPSIVNTMNELHRVLKPGSTVDIVVPTTDGRGAFQDPTHVSYWNRNTLFYFTHNDPHYTRFHEAYGIKGAFKVLRVTEDVLTDRVTKMTATLMPVKALGNEDTQEIPVETIQQAQQRIMQQQAEQTRLQQEAGNAVAQEQKEKGAQSNTTVEGVTANQPLPIFSILHATAHRLPYGWIEAWQAWSKAATHPKNVEYVLCVHESDIERVKEGASSIMNEEGVRLIITAQGNRYCAVDNWNTAAKASHGRILIMGADDFFPPMNWDGALLSAMSSAGKQLHDAFAIHVNVGSGDPDLASHPIMSRALYEKWGYFLYPEYEGVFCDNDFTAHANLEGVMIDARNLPFDHRHPIKNGVEAFRDALQHDAAYAAQNTKARYVQGGEIYKRRKALNFTEALQHNTSLPNLFICTPGESFSSLWMGKWTSMMLNLPRHFNVFPCNSYCSNVYTTRLALHHEAITLQPKSDFILWIDDDNLVSVEQVLTLYKNLIDHPEMDAIAGWCWIQGDERNGTRVSCGLFHEDGSCQGLSPSAMLSTDGSVPELLEISWTGFPVVLMRRSCLDKAGELAFSPVPTLHSRFGFMGEDVAFCMAAAKNGARFAVNRSIQVPHLKFRPLEYNAAAEAHRFAVPTDLSKELAGALQG